MVCRISETHANGCTGRFTKELSLVKSVTILTFFLSGLTTKKAGEHHSVGVRQGVLTCLARISLMQASAGSRNLNGNCLAAETRYGTALGLRKRCIFSVSMGLLSRLSLKTVGYLSRICRRVDVVTELTVWGKCSSMTFSLIRSCQDSSTGWTKFVVTRASVLIDLDLVYMITLEDPSTYICPPLALNS